MKSRVESDRWRGGIDRGTRSTKGMGQPRSNFDQGAELTEESARLRGQVNR